MSLKELLSDSSVEKKYVAAGALFGGDVSYIYMGECMCFEGHLDKWGEWEKEYSRRGYRTISLDKFIDLGGYNKPINNFIGQKREQGEEPIFHAELYRKEFLGKISPSINLSQMMEDKKTQFGGYTLPSTENRN